MNHEATQQDAGVTHSMHSWRLVLPTVIATVVALGCIAYLLQTGQRMATAYAPLADAMITLELDATRGHVWFEDLLSGGRNHKLAEVWDQLDRADAHARDMLPDVDTGRAPLPALDDPAMQQEVESIRDRLRDYRALAQRRLDALPGSPRVDELENGIDVAFDRIIEQAERVRGLLGEKAEAELAGFQRTAAALMLLMITVGIAAGVALHRHDSQRVKDYLSARKTIDKIRRQASALDYLAHFDALTQLPNRTLFFDRLGQVLAHANRRNQWAVLMFLDLEQVKSLDDPTGYPLDDHLLHETAERFTSMIRDEDSVARLGTNQFAILLPYQASRVESIRSASIVAEKIMRALRDPVPVDGKQALVACNIGVSLYPQDANNPDDLLKHADTAMYHAKQDGRNGYQFYSDDMNTVIRHRVLIEAGLRRALERKELFLHYQPVVDLSTGTIVGAEALLRWQHPERGLMLPHRFIQVAEETGVLLPLGEWVVHQACKQFLVWRGAARPLQRMIINLCPIQFRHAEMLEILRHAMSEYGLAQGALQVDVDESALMKDVDYSLRALRALKKSGVSLAIDDFGTGYSSMAFLKQFPMDTLKVHPSFVGDLGGSSGSDPVVTAMIQFAHTLGLEIIAEGVETEAQRDILHRLGCEKAQGNLLGPAMAVDEMSRLLNGESASGAPQS